MIVGGIDIGSLSAKALILQDGQKIRGWSLVLTGPDPVESASRVMDMAREKAGIQASEIEYIVSTGYGRVNVPFAQRSITEISCHARGNHWLFPSVRTILDMGGQDCKSIKCDENGNITNFAMNDKCAAGTGRYLERVAATLNLQLDEIGEKSLQSIGKPVPVTSTCVVFAEGDIIRLIREGKFVGDILAGTIDAIVERVIALLERVGIERDLCISGGVAKNIGVVRRLEKKLGLKAFIAHEPQIVGALGAALFASDLY
jgi:predicted CoA-substrate-specific enzyme activase